MIDMTSDSDNRKASRTCKSSPSSSEEVPCGGENHLKKGPWTTAEDAILVQYITQHGEGNWNSVQKHSGLSRCGKSCRLRWANHLRPDLKKGAFTEEEEALVIELHAKMGNKWARMAAELPGRTDNEIKNFWNTRFKKLQRAGLPIYPPDICVQALNESEQTDDMITGSEDIHQADALDIPDVEFKNLELNQGFLNCSPTMLNIHNFHKSVGPSQSFGYMFPEMNPHKRLREIGTQLRGSFDQYDDDDAFGRLSSVQSLWSPPSLEVPGSHIPINGKSSSSDLNSEAMKIELPSLQYSTSQVGVWATPSSPLPSLESSVDTLIQSPLSPSNCPSPRSSGLLEAIIYESRSMKNSNQPLSEAAFMAGDGVESSSGSGASFSEELQSADTGPGYMTAEVEPVDWASIESDGKKDISSPLEYLRPDALLDSFWFGHRISHSKEQIFTGDVGALLDEDLNCEYKPSESNQSFGPFSKND